MRKLPMPADRPASVTNLWFPALSRSMLTTLRIFLGGGRGGFAVEVTRHRGPVRGRWLGPSALVLIMPLALVVAGQALGSVTGWYSLDRAMNAPRGPWVYLLTAATAGVLLAVCGVLVARLRFAVERRERTRQVTVTLKLTTLEAIGFGIAAVFLALFAAHLVADGVACARGVVSAC